MSTRAEPVRPHLVLPIIAGVLFLTSAIMSLVSLITADSAGCQVYRQDIALFPLDWPRSGMLTCYVRNDALSSILLTTGFFALVVCAIIAVLVGRKDIKKAGFVIGIILSSITAVFAAYFFLGMASFTYPYGGQGAEVMRMLLYLSVPIVVIPLMRTHSRAGLNGWRLLLILVMAASVVGTDLYWSAQRGINFEASEMFGDDVGNLPLYAAFLVMAFSIRDVDGWQAPLAVTPPLVVTPKRSKVSPSVIVAGLFFLAAVLAVVSIAAGGFTGCTTWQWRGLFPMEWAFGNSYSCAIGGTLVPMVMSVLGLLALVGCGLLCLLVGKLDLRRAGRLSGVILVCVTAFSTFNAFMGMMVWDDEQHSRGGAIKWDSVLDFLVALMVPILILVMMRTVSAASRLEAKVLVIIAMVLVLFGDEVYSMFMYQVPHVVLSIILSNIGNAVIFAALLILAFSAEVRNCANSSMAEDLTAIQTP